MSHRKRLGLDAPRGEGKKNWPQSRITTPKVHKPTVSLPSVLSRRRGTTCIPTLRPATYFTVTEKFFDPKFIPPDDDVISKPYCTSPTIRSAIQPRFFR